MINKEYVLEYLGSPHLVLRNTLMWLQSREPYNGDFVFVLGPPRSGTTLLQNLILAHSKFGGWSHETSVFSPKNLFNRERFFYIDDDNYSLCRQSKTTLEFFVNLHRNFIHSGLIPVEKTPQHAKRLRFLLKKFPNGKFVFIVRDPRDAFYSGIRGNNIPQCNSARSYINYWLKCTRPFLETKSDNIKLVRYEDLTVNPHKEMSSVMSFLGFSLEKGQLEPKFRAHNPRISEGSAFEKLSEAIDNKSVGRYKELGPDVINKFNSLNTYLKRLGYEKMPTVSD